ncbi:MAG: hypothetical protein HQL63_15410 [Magnetococcales bacterium]|nr:hypothetical protein [Magnetococcales bacterium]MBF0322916.1 hypothetical protein [Magnetococcales bacterium]
MTTMPNKKRVGTTLIGAVLLASVGFGKPAPVEADAGTAALLFGGAILATAAVASNSQEAQTVYYTGRPETYVPPQSYLYPAVGPSPAVSYQTQPAQMYYKPPQAVIYSSVPMARPMQTPQTAGYVRDDDAMTVGSLSVSSPNATGSVSMGSVYYPAYSNQDPSGMSAPYAIGGPESGGPLVVGNANYGPGFPRAQVMPVGANNSGGIVVGPGSTSGLYPSDLATPYSMIR